MAYKLRLCNKMFENVRFFKKNNDPLIACQQQTVKGPIQRNRGEKRPAVIGAGRVSGLPEHWIWP